MKKLNEIAVPPQAHLEETGPPTKSGETAYTLVMHRLCKKYQVKRPATKLILSVIENMSRRGQVCLYKSDKLAELSGTTVAEAAEILQELESRGIIAVSRFGSTKGWVLTPDVKRDAVLIKKEIDASRKAP